ncbi:MAG: dephospho-CoA kinase [Actinobacteria bacterium]|nr:dephospho-CoA kinase [Actinomycetota bacterium]
MKVGLTGGIGAGKSTVADLFSQKGAVVIRSDELARQVIEPQTPGFQQVIDRFGKEFVNSEGYIDRAKLAEIVFQDDAALKDLENIVHPLVRSKTNQIIDQHTSETIIVNEIPLLLEKKMESLFDFLVIVISSEKNRLERLAQRGLTTEQATARMAKQVSDDERKAAADFLIVNDGNLDQLEADVEKIWQTLQERSFKS